MDNKDDIKVINQVGNDILTVAEAAGVSITYSPSFGKAILRKGTDWLALDEITRQPKQEATKPSSWEEFVEAAVEVHIRKNTDYQNAFMDVLLSKEVDGRSIWAWEVKKKLDRLRRWIKRGELLVKGEGCLDSVIDLSNYTVQYDISGKLAPYAYLTGENFKAMYEYLGHEYLLRYFTNAAWAGVKFLDLDDQVDVKVRDLLLEYWGTK